MKHRYEHCREGLYEELLVFLEDMEEGIVACVKSHEREDIGWPKKYGVCVRKGFTWTVYERNIENNKVHSPETFNSPEELLWKWDID